MFQGLPSPPTDNLYKFFAVFGLVFLVVSIGGFVLIHNSVMKTTMDHVQEVLTRLDSIEVPKDDLDKFAKAVAETIDAVFSLETELGSKINLAYASFGYIPEGLLSIGVLGLLMTTIGFSLWWFRVQRYQDAILRLEFLKATKEHETLNATSP